MLIGYARVSTADQSTDLQKDALMAAGVDERNIYIDKASGKRDDRPGLEACLKALREGDSLVVWRLDRLGRSLKHLVATVQDLVERGVGFRVLTGQGANIDTATASGKLVFGIFAALAEFERELIVERTKAGLAAAKARGRKGGRKPKLSQTTLAGAKARLAADPLLDKATLAKELSVHRTTLWRALERSTGTA
ncbi:MAG: transposon DNA-invertase [Alphaproteobacteria bacterium 64-6]|nr:recombinase family protein [Hyphomicrobium sp.]OJU21823.1 MAG: transposon DNA-invertase [Alphaproteobacteria bacterium 64-6]